MSKLPKQYLLEFIWEMSGSFVCWVFQFLHGCFLAWIGINGYKRNPDKAISGLIVGCVIGSLNIVLGVLSVASLIALAYLLIKGSKKDMEGGLKEKSA